MRKFNAYFLIMFAALYLYSNLSYSQQSVGKNASSMAKITSNHSTVKFNINNVSTLISNNGIADNYHDNAVFEFPKGSGKTAFYLTSVLWGAKVNGQIRAGGAFYVPLVTPGKIFEDGSYESPDAPNVRVYRVRKDFCNADLQMEADDEKKSIDEIFNQYDQDWNEWPANDGAPYEDINDDGIYTPQIDIPGIPGADQTLWFVANDHIEIDTVNFWDSLPMGIEMQTTVWGYKTESHLANAVFKKYLLINKSKNNFEDMYIGIFSDPDIGLASDDYAGCDTLLNLGYLYNSQPTDKNYGTAIPSAGVCLLQGPVVDGNKNDSVYFQNRWITGKKNLGMTSFYSLAIGYPPNSDPAPMNAWNYYNILQGLTPLLAEPIIDPSTGTKTKFTVPGDPRKKNGWYDAYDSTSGDRRFYISSGPFNMAPGDTQEITFVQSVSGLGDLASGIYNLKTNTYKIAKSFPSILYANTTSKKTLPEYFYLSNNFPNPFNLSTKILFEIPIDEDVRLEVFNVLGEKIRVLVDGFYKAGKYKVVFDGTGLSSGVYVASLKAGPYIKNKKMVFLK